MRRWADLFSIFCLLGLLAFGATTLLRVPRLGVADNGDFWRVMTPAGIEGPQGGNWRNQLVEPVYRTGPHDLGSTFSSAALVAWMAKSATWGITVAPGTLDLRQVGLLHLLLLAGLFTVAGMARLPLPFLAAAAYIAVDAGYLLFFNSFYADGTFFLALWGAVFALLAGGALAKKGSRAPVLLVVTALLGSFSKMQYAPFGAVLLLTVASLRLRGGLGIDARARRRSLLLLAALAVPAVAAPLHFVYGSGPSFDAVNKYHAVYAGILRLSQRPPGEICDDLGISSQFQDLPRRDVFAAGLSPDHPVFEELESVSRLRLAALYFREPVAVAAAAGQIQKSLGRTASHVRETFERASETRRRKPYRPGWQLASLRGRLLGGRTALIWLLLTAAGLSLLWRLGRFRSPRLLWQSKLREEGTVASNAYRDEASGPNGRVAAVLFLLLWIVSQMVVVILGDGLVSLQQHLVGTRLALDLLALVVLTSGVAHASCVVADVTTRGLQKGCL